MRLNKGLDSRPNTIMNQLNERTNYSVSVEIDLILLASLVQVLISRLGYE